MIKTPRLKNTGLCAIVKDEKMNAAGGIGDFIESTLPYLAGGVIIDTGSTDGTRQILERTTIRFPGLKVFDKLFNGFADARNYSLEKFKETGLEFAFVLDADERLTKQDFIKLQESLKSSQDEAFGFKFLDIYPDRSEPTYSYHSPRLFNIEMGLKYYDTCGVFEYISYPTGTRLNITIKHFRSVGETDKKQRIYAPAQREFKRTGKFPNLSENPFQVLAKKYNPQSRKLGRINFEASTSLIPAQL